MGQLSRWTGRVLVGGAVLAASFVVAVPAALAVDSAVLAEAKQQARAALDRPDCRLFVDGNRSTETSIQVFNRVQYNEQPNQFRQDQNGNDTAASSLGIGATTINLFKPFYDGNFSIPWLSAVDPGLTAVEKRTLVLLHEYAHITNALPAHTVFDQGQVFNEILLHQCIRVTGPPVITSFFCGVQPGASYVCIVTWAGGANPDVVTFNGIEPPDPDYATQFAFTNEWCNQYPLIVEVEVTDILNRSDSRAIAVDCSQVPPIDEPQW